MIVDGAWADAFLHHHPCEAISRYVSSVAPPPPHSRLYCVSVVKMTVLYRHGLCLTIAMFATVAQEQELVRAMGYAPGSDEATHEGSGAQGGQTRKQGDAFLGLETHQVCIVHSRFMG